MRQPDGDAVLSPTYDDEVYASPADAALIAAAPELLELVRVVIRLCSTDGNEPCGKPGCWGCVKLRLLDRLKAAGAIE